MEKRQKIRELKRAAKNALENGQPKHAAALMAQAKTLEIQILNDQVLNLSQNVTESDVDAAIRFSLSPPERNGHAFASDDLKI